MQNPSLLLFYMFTLAYCWAFLFVQNICKTSYKHFLLSFQNLERLKIWVINHCNLFAIAILSHCHGLNWRLWDVGCSLFRNLLPLHWISGTRLNKAIYLILFQSSPFPSWNKLLLLTLGSFPSLPGLSFLIFILKCS